MNQVSTHAPLLAGLLLLTAGCSSAPPGTEHPGRGVVTVDVAVPAEAEVTERPQWHVGDRFVYRRGGLVQVAFRVISASDDGYVLEEETTGLRNSFTADLGVRGQELPSDSSMTRTLDPFDANLSWPLWSGKKWVCHFVRRGGDVDVPILARYECDATETLTTPAGSFQTFRIWRRTQPANDGEYFEKNDLMWYAPEVGFFVRKLEDGMLTEIEEFSRPHAQ